MLEESHVLDAEYSQVLALVLGSECVDAYSMVKNN